MNADQDRLSFSLSIPIVIALAMLYSGLVMREWRSVADLREMVVPCLAFGIATGLVPAVLPWVQRPPRIGAQFSLFATAAAISATAIIATIVLFKAGVPATFPYEPGPKCESWLYNGMAFASPIVFGLIALLGQALNSPLRRAVGLSRFLGTFAQDDQAGLVTAALGLLTAMLTVFAKSGGT